MPQSDLASVLAPIERATGLPNAHYVSEAVFDEERERLLFDSWAGLCFGSDIPEPGDVMPVDFAGQPLVAVRGRDGNIRVFQNTCRHRGMILVEAKGKVGGVIRCPYHSWCYAHTGELVATPHVGGPGMNTCDGVERETLGLIEIRSRLWRDVIFVNLSGNAPPFESRAAGVIERWGEFEGQPLYHAGEDSRFAFEVACNWKLAVENYCESYHLPWVHPGLNSYSRLEDHYHIEQEDFSGQGTRVYRPMITEDGRRFPDFAGLSEKWDAGAEYIAFYPNVLLAVHRDHAYAMVLLPQGPGRTIERVAISYASEDAVGASWAEMRARNTAMWKEVLEEDLFVVEGMQKGRQARHFDGGRFSPAMDGPTHRFHRWVARRMTGVDSAG